MIYFLRQFEWTAPQWVCVCVLVIGVSFVSFHFCASSRVFSVPHCNWSTIYGWDFCFRVHTSEFVDLYARNGPIILWGNKMCTNNHASECIWQHRSTLSPRVLWFACNGISFGASHSEFLRAILWINYLAFGSFQLITTIIIRMDWHRCNSMSKLLNVFVWSSLHRVPCKILSPSLAISF